MGVAGVDVVYSDVWVSMGELVGDWTQRIVLLTPYQVSGPVLDMTGKSVIKLVHCVPALHICHTQLGEELFQKTGLTAFEVTDDVFESPASFGFDQPENRLHTIKALGVATARLTT